MAHQLMFWISAAAAAGVLVLLAVVKVSQGRRGFEDSPQVQELPKD